MTEAVAQRIGGDAYRLIERLYPLCRSITGNGVRQTFDILAEHIPLQRYEIPSGTRVFDWEVPKEWNIRDAYVKDEQGERVVDFQASNLHVVSYSTPVRTTMNLAQLSEHIFTLPEQPDWIPYRTSYYNETWGFCLRQRELEALTEQNYEVVIDSSLEDGHLSYAECHVPGRSTDEVLIYTHVCHPSLCNDNLSGIAVVTQLAKWLMTIERHWSYRFVFAPGTIGSITWLSQNESALHRIKHGLVVALVGDPGAFTYKQSRREDARINRIVAHVLRHAGFAHSCEEFSPYGYDERQFCSPGINLALGRLTRSPNGVYPQYHSSADDLSLVSATALAESFTVCQNVIEILERDAVYVNTNPKCEPQLGRRGLYRKTGGSDIGTRQTAMLWVLNQSDGTHSLLDIADKAGIPFAAVVDVADELRESGLLAPT